MLIKVILIAVAVIAGIAVIVVRERETQRPPAATTLRQPTPAERRLLDSIPTVVPQPKGAMH
jgi:hypothetical protein